MSDPHLSDAALLARLQQAVRALPDAPPHLVQAAVALWPAAAAAAGAPVATAPRQALPGLPAAVAAVAAAIGAGLRPVLAELRLDSWASSPLAAGLRGAGTASRQLLFSAAGHDIDLRIEPAQAGHWLLQGQLLGPQASAELSLTPLADVAAVRHGALDDLGEFHFDAVPGGQWTLRLALLDCLVELPALHLGAADGRASRGPLSDA